MDKIRKKEESEGRIKIIIIRIPQRISLILLEKKRH